MPCRYYLPGEEAELNSSTIKKLTEDLDRLTHENDMLREIIIESDKSGFPVDLSEKEEKMIYKNQEAHRKEDLKRLETVFRACRDAEKLGKVMLADPKKPLAPQLGFDPDGY